jgi:uncharacterized membrane protein
VFLEQVVVVGQYLLEQQVQVEMVVGVLVQLVQTQCQQELLEQLTQVVEVEVQEELVVLVVQEL